MGSRSEADSEPRIDRNTGSHSLRGTVITEGIMITKIDIMICIQ